MNWKLKILVLLVTVSLGSSIVFMPTEVYAGSEPVQMAGDSMNLSGGTVLGQSDAGDDGTDPGGSDGSTEGDPDDVGGGFGARGEFISWGAECDGELLETLERWLLFLMLQVAPTP